MNFNLFDDYDDRVVYNNKSSYEHESNMPKKSQSDEKYDGSTPAFPPNTPVGMAYVPFQQWGDVYEINEAFPKGTIFPELNFPFMRGAGNNE